MQNSLSVVGPRLTSGLEKHGHPTRIDGRNLVSLCFIVKNEWFITKIHFTTITITISQNAVQTATIFLSHQRSKSVQ